MSIMLRNDSINHPLRYELLGRTFGMFYDSISKMFHLAEYVPYRRPPDRYVCGGFGNFSPVRDAPEEAAKRKRGLCPRCWEGTEPNLDVVKECNMYKKALDKTGVSVYNSS
jgi:hypothetical protein